MARFLAVVVLLVLSGRSFVEDVAESDDAGGVVFVEAEIVELGESTGRDLFDDEIALLSQFGLSPKIGFFGVTDTGQPARSDEGHEWEELSTAGLPADAGLDLLIAGEDDNWVAIADSASSADRWLVASADFTTWKAVELPNFANGPDMFGDVLSLAISDGTVVLAGASFALESAEVQSRLLVGPISGPFEFVDGPALDTVIDVPGGFVGLARVFDDSQHAHVRLYSSIDGMMWESISDVEGYFPDVKRLEDILILAGETAPENERVAIAYTSTDFGRSWEQIQLPVELYDGWATSMVGPSSIVVFVEGSEEPFSETNSFERPWIAAAFHSWTGSDWTKLDADLVVSDEAIPANQVIAVIEDALLVVNHDTEGEPTIERRWLPQ